MYLLIIEDGGIKKISTITDQLKKSADDGYLDIIDLHTENPMLWIKGQWIAIDSV